MSAVGIRDLAALRAALLVLLSPFDYPDTVVWRRAAAQALRACLGADSVYVTLPAAAPAVMVGTGEMDPRALAAYIAHYHHRNPADRERLRRRLSHWTREGLVPLGELCRTEYFADYCRPNGLISSCGMATLPPGPTDSEAIVHVTSTDTGHYLPEGREEQLLSLLQPAFAAGIRAALLSATWQGELRRELDAGASAIAVCDPKGRMLHATPRLLELVKADAEGSRILAGVSRAAADIGALLCRQRDARPDVSASHAVDTRRGRYTVRASLLRTPELLGQSPLVLLVIEPPSRLARPSEAELHERFGLTAREAEAALLLAQGVRNRELAAALGVGEHTARRHTEHVLTKLDVTSRAAVAAAIGAR
jgi:DNA-binding CsgD family transcriptional regulator